MAFDPISAAISGGLGLASAFLGSNAASSAGKAQAAALDRATAAQQAQAAQTRADLAPWRETGTGALYHLADLYGVPRSDGAGGMTAGSDFTGTPGYQFRFGEGLRGVNNSASAAGLIDSGSRLRALTDYGQGQAANEWGDYRGTIQSLAGVGQTQVNSKIDLTFAKALRAILRQDPDTIMIGEIRDFETAQIAIQASLTGHLVLATLHTNDAASAVTRLTDMGVEPFLLSSSLLGVLAQRLVRKICHACQGKGCDACGHTGYAGRTGVFELLVTTDAIRAQIHNQASEADIRAAALANGMALMRDDGERLIAAGITSREEVVRVTRD